MLAALQWRSYVDTQQTHEVETTTQAVRASLAVAVQRDGDLVQTLGGLVATGTPVTNTQVQALYTEVGGTNTAGIIGLAYIQRVPDAELGTFERQVHADPPFGLLLSAGPQQTEGPQSRYCLIRLAAESAEGLHDLSAAGRTTLISRITSQYDYCTSPFAPALAKAAATGRASVTLLDADLAAQTGHHSPNDFFEIVMAVYPAATPAATLRSETARDPAVLGWAIGLFSAAPLLDPLVTTTRGLAVAIRHTNATGTLTVASHGTAGGGAIHRVVSLAGRGTWSASIAMVPPNASATAQGIGVLADLLVIVLLVTLIAVLLRSRRRAFRSIEQKNQELRHRALHDTLTGLPNRDLIIETADEMLAAAGSNSGALAVLLIDLDDFTWINNTYGHRVGDDVLVTSARRIGDVLGPGDRLGRLAGDEFVILTDAAWTSPDASELAGRVLAALSEPMKLSDEGFGMATRITACIGVATGTGCRGEDLLRDADTALTEAKRTGKRRIGRFEPAMHRAARERLAMAGDLRSALEEHQFFLQYQPVFALPDLVPIGVEALVRWRHPFRGVVAPLEFIPLLETTGMINELGHEVLDMACRQAEEWQRRGLAMFVSVNASALQLESDSFVGEVARVLEDTGLDPGHLSIEVTESALMHHANETVRRLANLKRLGIRLAIDDFGTGYSSLAYLRHFPVDVIKIDRAFVVAMTTAPGGMALMRTVLELARSLGLETVAEGIEDEAQLRALVAEGCGAGQGFFLSPPLRAEQIELFFDNARPRALTSVLARS